MKIHYKLAICHSKLLVYQRVCASTQSCRQLAASACRCWALSFMFIESARERRQRQSW